MYGNYSQSAGEAIFYLVAFFAVVIILFLIIRALVLWYFRINDLIDQVKITNALLSKSAGFLIPGPVEQAINQRDQKQAITQEDRETVTKDWTQKDWDRYYETGVMKKQETKQEDKQSQ